MTEVGFDEWLEVEQQSLHAFYSWWLERHELDPENFPLEMEVGEWDEQYRIWEP